MNAQSQIAFRRFTVGAFLCFLVAFGCAWVYVIERPMYYYEMAYPIWLERMHSLKGNTFGSLAILGDSRPMADLMPARLGPGVTNFALPGAMPIESFYIAQHITSGAASPKAVIISFTPSHFMQKESFWDFAVGFGLLTLPQVNEVRMNSRDLNDEEIFGPQSPGDLDARFKSFLFTSKFPAYRFTAISTTLLHPNYAKNKEMLDFVIANRGRGHVGLADGTSEPDTDSKLKAFVPAKLLDLYFEQTLALLQARGVPVYFIGMPHNATSDPLYDHGLRKDYVDYLQHFTAKYPNFHILGDPFPSYPPEYFGDPDHLNEKGAVKWSDQVALLLNEHHVAGGPFGPTQDGLTRTAE